VKSVLHVNAKNTIGTPMQGVKINMTDGQENYLKEKTTNSYGNLLYILCPAYIQNRTTIDYSIGKCNISINHLNSEQYRLINMSILKTHLEVFIIDYAPIIVIDDTKKGIEDTLYENTISVIDYDPVDTFSWVVIDNASWLNWGSNNLTLFGKPTNADVGDFWVCIKVTDNYNNFDIHNFTLTVINTDPKIITDNNPIAIEDSLYSVDYDCDDDGMGMMKWDLITNASWLKIDTNTGLLNGTPHNNDVGEFRVNISVIDDHGGIGYNNFTLTVFNTNDNPFINTIDVLSIDEDEYYEVIYTASDIDIGDMLTWTFDSNASWVHWGSENHTLYGTPRNEDVGTYWIQINVSDGNEGYSEHYFILTVINTNDAPIINTLDISEAKEDEYYEVIYTATDIDIGDTLTWTFISNASWLKWGSENRTLYGIPRNEDVGKYWVKINVFDDNMGYDEHNFIISVINVNDAPTIIGAPTTLEVDAYESKFLNFLPYMRDIDNQTEDLRLIENSNYVTIEDSNIIFKYPNSISSENVEIRVSDGIGISPPHSILVTVKQKEIDHPEIIKKSPVGSNIPITTNITITFNEGMNKDSVENSFLSQPTIQGKFIWTENTVILIPESYLPYNTTYTITIQFEAVNLDGIPLEDIYSWNFTTERFDTDNDGTPDSEDDDDDNDGFIDEWEELLDTDPKDYDDKPLDTDFDGKPDGDDTNSQRWMDNDDDNDNVLDKDEYTMGTNPLLKDSDGDGHDDGDDKYPLDSSKWEQEKESTEKEQSNFNYIIIIILIVAIIIFIIFSFQKKFKKKSEDIAEKHTEQIPESKPPLEKVTYSQTPQLSQQSQYPQDSISPPQQSAQIIPVPIGKNDEGKQFEDPIQKLNSPLKLPENNIQENVGYEEFAGLEIAGYTKPVQQKYSDEIKNDEQY
jgi:hypothetical protein